MAGHVGREQGPGQEPLSEARGSVLSLSASSRRPSRPGATLASTYLAPSLTAKNTWLVSPNTARSSRPFAAENGSASNFQSPRKLIEFYDWVIHRS